MNAAAGAHFVTRRTPNLVAGLLALGVHGIFVLLLVFGVSWQTRHPEQVMVDIWQSLPRFEPPPATRPIHAVKPVFKEAPLPDTRDADIALEKKKAETAHLKKLQAMQAAEDKARAEAERKKLLAEQKKRALLHQMEEEDLKQRIASETAATQARTAKLTEAQAKQAETASASKRQAEVAHTVGQYRDLISATVHGNTRLPDNLKGNPEVRCLVKLLPTGEVLNVQVTQSSGNAAYDEAVVRAIRKSSPLPLPGDREARAAFVPELSFVHRPKN